MGILPYGPTGVCLAPREYLTCGKHSVNMTRSAPLAVEEGVSFLAVIVSTVHSQFSS